MRWSAVRSHLLVGCVAVVTAVAMTWPLALHATTSVQDLGDPLLQLWTLKWDLHQLASDPLHLYDANTFTPFPRPLAYSESMLGIALLFAPAYWLTGNDVLAYNLVVLFTFAGSVVTTYLLARQFTRWTLAALLAGLAFAFMPYRFGHLSHLNLLSLQWLPLALLCLVLFLRTGRAVWIGAFAVTFLLQALSSFYYAYLAAVACAVVALALLPWRDPTVLRSRLLGLAAAGLVLALVMVPVSLPYFGVRATMGFERTAEDVDALAATPKSYLAVAPESRLYEKRLPQRYPNPLFPGAVIAGLAAVGLLTQRRRLTLALAATGLLGVLLSFGISLNVGGRELPMPYGLLFEYLPGARGLRDIARFGVLALLALAVLAAAGLGWLCDRLGGGAGRGSGARGQGFPHPLPLGEGRGEGDSSLITHHSSPTPNPRPPRQWAAQALAALACLVTLAEFASGFVDVVPVPRDDETLAAYRWLAHQPRGLVMEFPADNIRGGSVTGTTRYMYYSTYHWQPLVLGYSGFVPPLHYQLIASFPDERRTETPSHLNVGNVGLLRDLGVRYVLFHRFRYSGGGWKIVQDNLRQIDGLTFVGQLGHTWVYTLDPGDRSPVQAELLLPNRAVAGQTYLAHYALQNSNPTSAAHGLGGQARLEIAWWDEQGRAVAQAEVEFQPGAIMATGTRLIPLGLGPAPAAGDYRLAVTSTDPRLAPLLPKAPMAVTVLPARVVAGRDDPPRLARLAWPERAYRPGETIPVALTWQATGALPGQTIFFQLIGPDNKVWGQRDGDALDTRRPAATWLPGEVIEDRRDLPVQPDAPPGRYRVLVGLYDPSTGQRLPIRGPDGAATATEIWSAPVEIVART